MFISNVEIFNDTIKRITTNETLKEKTENSKKKTTLYEENKILKINTKADKLGKIKVINDRSFNAAKDLKNVSVLNFASATNPGGGVKKGSSAQEECLCRISTLYPCLNSSYLFKNFYDYHRKRNNTLYTNRAIYSKDVTIIKTDTINPTLMDEELWYNVNVITCAAPNIRNLKINENELLKLFKERIERILQIAIINGDTNIVLGAWGCGAFKNSPYLVGRAFKEVLENYRYYFDNIIFAVLVTPGYNGDENFKIFERFFKEK